MGVREGECACAWGGGAAFDVASEDLPHAGPGDGCAVVDDETEGDARGGGVGELVGVRVGGTVADCMCCFCEDEIRDAGWVR